MSDKGSIIIFLEKVLRILSGKSEAEALLGDMEELYHHKLRSAGRIRAVSWYLTCVLRMVPEYLLNTTEHTMASGGNYMKTTLRNAMNYKTNSLIKATSLLVGMATFLIIGLDIIYEYSWDKFHRNGERIFRVQAIRDYKDQRSYLSQVAYPVAGGLKEKYPEIEESAVIAEIWGEHLSTSDGTKLYAPDGYFADNRFFNIFTVNFTKDSETRPLSSPGSIILSKSIAGKYFPNQNPIGKMIRNGTGYNLRVSAVYEDFPENSHIRPSYMLSFKIFENTYNTRLKESWEKSFCRVYVMLKNGVDYKSFEKKIAGFKNQYVKNNHKQLYLNPLKEMHLKPGATNDLELVIYYYGIIGAFALLIACINFINLTTAQFSVREKEIGIRKIMGSSRRALIRQFTGEAVVLSVIAMIAAIGVAALTLPLYSTIMEKPLVPSMLLTPSAISISLGIAVLTGAVSGIYPALLISAVPASSILKSCTGTTSASAGRKGLLRKVLTTFQLALAITLLFMTMYMFRQISFMQKKDLGFDYNGLFTCRLSGVDSDTVRTLRNELLREPDVVNATASYNAPFHRTSMHPINWEGAAPEEKISSRMNLVDHNFIDTYQMKIQQGRNFSVKMSTDSNKCLVNETFVKTVGWKQPLGKHINNNKYQVIGVIKDFHPTTVHEKILPYYMVLSKDFDHTNRLFTIRVRSKSGTKTPDHINRVFKQIYPDKVFEVQHFQESMNSSTIKIYRKIGSGFLFFSVITLLMAASGLFALISFNVERRAKELSIKKVLGATTGRLYMNVTTEFIFLILAASLISIPLGFKITDTIPSAYKYHPGMTDILLLITIISVTAFITTLGKAYKAASRNPASNLKAD